MQNTKPQVVAKLPDDIKDQLVQLADDGDKQWLQSARILDQMFEDAKDEGVRLPKMKMYQDAAAYLGQKSSTVRNWTAIYHKVGDDLLDEYGSTFRYSHWRAIVPAARKAKKTVADFAAELAKTADEYGGMPIPPDVIIARTDQVEKSDEELFTEELEAVRLNLANMSRHVSKVHPKLRSDVLVLMSGAEDLAGKVEAENKKGSN